MLLKTGLILSRCTVGVVLIPDPFQSKVRERLQKIIAGSGITSRRKAEALILEGRVLVNGRVATLGMKADPDRDYIKVDGRLITEPGARIYAVLNKPSGVLTTLDETEERPTIAEFTRKIKPRVYPVGRLDYYTEGLLLLTNDGELAHRITHPSYRVSKVYLVKTKGVVEEEDIDRLRRGIRLNDGMTAPAKIRRITMPRTEKNAWYEVTVFEGRNRLIRRMFDKVRHPVLKLKRTGIDGIRLGDLPVGEWRYLSSGEIERLKKSVKML
jgi:23S rRNA pseudouridine2605 synthase